MDIKGSLKKVWDKYKRMHPIAQLVIGSLALTAAVNGTIALGKMGVNAFKENKSDLTSAPIIQEHNVQKPELALKINAPKPTI